MRLIKTVPRQDERPELKVFECPACGNFRTIATDGPNHRDQAEVNGVMLHAPATDGEIARPRCRNCAVPLRLIKTVPHQDARPELRVFECPACGNSCTVAADTSRGLSEGTG